MPAFLYFNYWYLCDNKRIKRVIQFKITQSDNTYIAEGVDLAIVTGTDTPDELMKNISEATELHYEDEDNPYEHWETVIDFVKETGKAMPMKELLTSMKSYRQKS